jgi:hypothetical protein
MNQNIVDRCLSDILENGYSTEQCLDKFPEDRDELEPILRVAVSLISAQRLKASSRFRRISWIRIQNQVTDRNTVKSPNHNALESTVSSWFKKPQVLRLAFLSLVVLVFLAVGFSGVVMASASALPGDWLYPTKLQVERMQLFMAVPGVERAAMRLELASRRLSEVDDLLDEQRAVKVDEVITAYKTQVQSVFDEIETDMEMSPEDRSIIFILLRDWYSMNKNHLDKILIKVPDLPFESVSQTNDFSRLTQDRVIKLFQQYPYLLYTLPEFSQEGSIVEPGLDGTSVMTATEIITPSIVIADPAISNGQYLKLPARHFPDGIEEEYLLKQIIPLMSTYFPDEPLLPQNLPDLIKTPRPPEKKDMEDFPGFEFPTKWPESFPDDSTEP